MGLSTPLPQRECHQSGQKVGAVELPGFSGCGSSLQSGGGTEARRLGNAVSPASSGPGAYHRPIFSIPRRHLSIRQWCGLKCRAPAKVLQHQLSFSCQAGVGGCSGTPILQCQGGREAFAAGNWRGSLPSPWHLSLAPRCVRMLTHTA